MAQKYPCCIDEVATVEGEGGEREEGSGKVVEGIDDTNGAQQMVVPVIDINQPPVDYQSVCKLPSKYKMYKEIIMKNISALFPEGCKGTGLSVVSTHLRITGPSWPGGGGRGTVQVLYLATPLHIHTQVLSHVGSLVQLTLVAAVFLLG